MDWVEDDFAAGFRLRESQRQGRLRLRRELHDLNLGAARGIFQGHHGMEQVRERTFNGGEMVETDARHFIKCRFDGAQLRYCGGEHRTSEIAPSPMSAGIFDGAALRTIQLLQANGNAPGGRT